MRHWTLLVLLFALVALPAFAQPQAPRDTPPPATGTAVLRGRITDASTGQPIRRATVRIIGPQLREMHSTLTDSDGRYEFRDLPSDSLSVSASKAGYVDLSYGQLGAQELGNKPVKITDRATVDRIDIALPRGGVIVGRVIDDTGDAVTDAQVSALRLDYSQTGRRPVNAGRSSQSNDIGEFRIFGLPPGRYFVSAIYRSTFSGSAARNDQRSGYAPTYFPGTTNLAEAQMVTVTAGQTTGEVVLQLVATRTARVSGMVVDGQRRPATGGSVMLTAQSGNVSSTIGNSGLRPDGTFVINDVPPGDYVLRASIGRVPTTPGTMFIPETGMANVTVNGDDVSGLLISPMKPMTVRGRVIVAANATSAFTPSALRVTAQPNNNGAPIFLPGGMPPPPPVNDDMTFEFQSYPGPFIIRAQNTARTGPNAPIWTIRSITVNGTDVTDGITFTSADVGDVIVEMTDRVQDLSGVLVNGRGEPVPDYSVIIFAEDPARWESIGVGRAVLGRTDSDGRYRVRTLRPGNYLVAPVGRVQTGQWLDPEFLKSVQPRALRVTLQEGDTQTLNLTVP